MFDWIMAARAIPLLLMIAILTWLVSLLKKDVSIVDSVWSIFFIAALLTWYRASLVIGPRSLVALVLVILWGARLSFYLTRRNAGKPEDRRYQAIRERNQPHYELKSLVIVFFLQAILAWLIALPILPVVQSPENWNWLDSIGTAVFIAGLLYETIADMQLSRFKSQPGNENTVLDTGLWRYCRHPNYFGEALLWWGFFLIALGAGAPVWLIISPLLITLLLVKISGVPLLEQDIGSRRPHYREYLASTSSFIPMPPRTGRKA